MTPDQFESQDFYELMQEYRIAPLWDQDRTVRAFERVKTFARAAVAEEREAHKATMVLVMSLLDEIKAQWGEDYLWQKWKLDEDIAAIRERTP